MNILSLFDGISCGQIALNRSNIKYKNYFASEIKKNAIKVTQNNYPNTIQLGDINHWELWNLPYIDLILCGSPCQDFSILKNGGRNGFYGEKSKLFFVFLDILNKLRFQNKKIKFIFENVNMKKNYSDAIDERLEVDHVKINSNLVSFQNRNRLYWTNINNICIPNDRNISFQDNKSNDYEYLKKFKVKKTPSRIKMYEYQCPNVTYRDKINAITRKQDGRNNAGLVDFEDFCRFLTTEELERAQTLPIGYTKLLSIRQSEDVIGDGWTIDVISHILNHIT